MRSKGFLSNLLVLLALAGAFAIAAPAHPRHDTRSFRTPQRYFRMPSPRVERARPYVYRWQSPHRVAPRLRIQRYRRAMI
jgi:hypothetical protein